MTNPESELKGKVASWDCKYCNEVNPSSKQICRSCGKNRHTAFSYPPKKPAEVKYGKFL
jgi:hypothetical protein